MFISSAGLCARWKGTNMRMRIRVPGCFVDKSFVTPSDKDHKVIEQKKSGTCRKVP